jgi:hypothetical protein
LEFFGGCQGTKSPKKIGEAATEKVDPYLHQASKYSYPDPFKKIQDVLKMPKPPIIAHKRTIKDFFGEPTKRSKHASTLAGLDGLVDGLVDGLDAEPQFRQFGPFLIHVSTLRPNTRITTQHEETETTTFEDGSTKTVTITTTTSCEVVPRHPPPPVAQPPPVAVEGEDEEEEEEDEPEEPEEEEFAETRAQTIERLTDMLRTFDYNAMKSFNTRMIAKDRKLLIEECAANGLVPCTVGSCRSVKEKNCFTPSGLRTFLCKMCQSASGKARTALQMFERSLQLAQRIDKLPVVRDTGKKEDAFVRWLVKKLESEFNFIVMPEFRRTDIIFQLKTSTDTDQWLRLQIKTAIMREQGNAIFNHCFGYGVGDELEADNDKNRMLVLCALIELQENDDDDTSTKLEISGSPKLWLLDGADVPANQMVTSMHNSAILCPTTLHKSCLSINTVLEKLSSACTGHTASFYPLTNESEAWCDLENKDQRREAFTMLSFLHVGQGFEINFPTGNSSAVDSMLNLNDGCGPVDSQHKGMNVKSNGIFMAGVFHNEKGIDARPYGDWHGIGRLVYQLIVKDGPHGDFYLLYGVVPREELVKPRRSSKDHDVTNTIFTTRDEKTGLVNFPGKTSIHIPLGKYSKWLTGREKPPDLCLQTEWLEEGTSFGLRAPLNITPETGKDARLTIEVLNEIAHVARVPMF